MHGGNTSACANTYTHERLHAHEHQHVFARMLHMHIT